MITVELQIEESALAELDEVVAQLGISRDAYIRTAVKHTLALYRPKEWDAEDEINTFLLWLAEDDDDPDTFSPLD